MPKRESKLGLFGVPEDFVAAEAGESQYTGRYLVLLQEEAQEEGVKALRKSAGVKSVANAADFKEQFTAEAVAGAEVFVMPELGVALVSAPPDKTTALQQMQEGAEGIEAIEPEQVCHAVQLEDGGGRPGASLDYVRGFRDGVNKLSESILTGAPPAEAELEAAAIDESQFTWGLQVTRSHVSRFSGRGVRVAVLDTGMDFRHPDFAGRRMAARSFVPGQTPQDGHSHGTHCIGTACGPLRPGRPPRYGIAHRSDIFVGKVLSNGGSGGDGGILAGINWAVANRCQVVSMSLGATLLSCRPFSAVYEAVALRALRAGTLIIAAAGNDSRRPASIRPVSHPANCPSIMAVGALDQRLSPAFFSNGGICSQGNVDIAGPGVDVYSSVPMPTRYGRKSGTSMATPHVAGIAALWSEATGVTGGALWATLVRRARRLPHLARDVGAGLVIAP